MILAIFILLALLAVNEFTQVNSPYIGVAAFSLIAYVLYCVVI